MKKFVKRLAVLLLCLLSVVFFVIGAVACEKNPAEEENKEDITLTISNSSCEISEYQEYQLTATCNKAGKTITWSSSNTEVATVSDTGLITAISVGSAEITATVENVSKKCYLTVKENTELATINLVGVMDDYLSIIKGDSFSINAVIKFGEEEKQGEIEYESLDSDIATVSSDGELTAVKAGETTIVITGKFTILGKEKFAETKEITVKVVENISMSLTAEAGKTVYAIGEIEGKTYDTEIVLTKSFNVLGEETEVEFSYESSDSSVATVTKDLNGNAKVQALKAGTTIIKATCEYQEETYECFKEVEVSYLVIKRDTESIMLSKSAGITTEDLKVVFKDGREITKITEKSALIEDDDYINVAIENGEISTCESGERVWRIYNDAYAYEMRFTVADYIIESAKQFKEVLSTDNKQKIDGAYIVLGNNIEGVGDYYGQKEFNGILDGRGYTVSGINITGNGLFTETSGSALMKNVAFIDVKLGKLSGTLANQATGLTVDNVLIKIKEMSYDDNNPSGAVVLQVGTNLVINNTVVEATGISGENTNAGAIAGAWWYVDKESGRSGNITVNNSAIITDGKPFGIKLNPKNEDVSEHNNADKGYEENQNEKVKQTYCMYANYTALKGAIDGGTIDLSAFSDEYWDKDNGGLDFYSNPITHEEQYENFIKGNLSQDELYYFGKDLETTYSSESIVEKSQRKYYKITLIEEITEVKGVRIGSHDILDFDYDKANKQLYVSSREIEKIACGSYKITLISGSIRHQGKITVADEIITTAEELKAVLCGTDNLNDYIILGGDIDGVNEYENLNSVNAFTGTFDGKGYSIKNIVSTGYAFITYNSGTIKNFALINANFGKNATSIISNENFGTIENVFVSGTTTATSLINVNYARRTVRNIVAEITSSNTNLNYGAIVRSNEKAEAEGVEYIGIITECYAVSNLTGGVASGKTPVSDGNYAKGNQLVEALSGKEFGYFKADENGLSYNGNIVIKKSIELTGDLKNGEYYYFDKSVDQDYGINIQLTGDIIGVKIGSGEVPSSYSQGVLTIDNTEVKAIDCGNKVLTIETELSTYSMKVTVADFVITTAEEFKTAFIEGKNMTGYYILGSDISNFGEYKKTYTDGWDVNNGFILDGKGYTVSGINFTGHGLFPKARMAIIKNIAFTEVQTSMTAVLGNEYVQCNIENVYVSGKSTNPNGGLINSAQGLMKIKNCIVNMESSIKGGGAIVNNLAALGEDKGQITDCYALSGTYDKIAKTNSGEISGSSVFISSYALIETLNKKEDFFGEIWGKDNDGNISFGGRTVITNDNGDLYCDDIEWKTV